MEATAPVTLIHGDSGNTEWYTPEWILDVTPCDGRHQPGSSNHCSGGKYGCGRDVTSLRLTMGWPSRGPETSG